MPHGILVLVPWSQPPPPLLIMTLWKVKPLSVYVGLEYDVSP
jgi:hypothetical protein